MLILILSLSIEELCDKNSETTLVFSFTERTLHIFLNVAKNCYEYKKKLISGEIGYFISNIRSFDKLNNFYFTFLQQKNA